MMAADVAAAISEEADASEEVADFYTLDASVETNSSEDVNELAFTSMLFKDAGQAEIDGSMPIQIMAYSMVDGLDESVESYEFTPEMVMRSLSLSDLTETMDPETALFDQSTIFETGFFEGSTPDDAAIAFPSIEVALDDSNSPVIYYMMGSSGGNEDGEVQVEQASSEDLDFHVMNFSTQNQWHNSSFPEDIDGSNSVTPVDVLILINVLNQGGRGSIGNFDLTTISADQSYLDVNRDQSITPIDALIVINYINSNTPSSEQTNEDADANNQTSLFAPEIGRMAIIAGDEKIESSQQDADVMLDYYVEGVDSFEADSSAARIAYTLVADYADGVESDAKAVDAVFEDELSELLSI